MKKLILLVVMMFALLACSQEIKKPDDDMMVSYEMGVNFTDYMRVTYQEANPKLYEMLFTHKMDYLVPQVFYYIPMDNHLNTYSDWVVYFENWSIALKNHDMTPIKTYIEGSTLENYISKKFEEALILDIVYVFVDQYASIYLDGFKEYEDLWPAISKDLYQEAVILDEYIKSNDLLDKWHHETDMQLDLEIYLSYYGHDDLRSTSASNRKVVLYKTDQSLIELYQDISLIYGRHLLQKDLSETVKELYKKYAYLDEPLDQVFKTLTDQMIKVYDSKVTDKEYVYSIEIPPVVHQYESQLNASDYIKLVYEWYLDKLKSMKPYVIDGVMYYDGVAYETLKVDDTRSVYYHFQWPIIVDSNTGYKVLTDDMDALPELSPDHSKLAFISPFAFETYGHIYVYDFETDKLEQLLKSEEPNGTVKVLKWYDDHRLIYISGFAYGTVTQGGNLYTMDIHEKEEVLLLSLDGPSHEISDIYYDDAWYYRLVSHNDDMTDYTEEILELDLKTMLE